MIRVFALGCILGIVGACPVDAHGACQIFRIRKLAKVVKRVAIRAHRFTRVRRCR